MDTNALTALAGLVGAVVGGTTSVLTSWLAQRTQTNTQWRRQEHQRREDLYNAFIENAVECYADALQHDGPDVPAMVSLYAKVDQMYLRSSRPVIESAEEICRRILETSAIPTRNFRSCARVSPTGRSGCWSNSARPAGSSSTRCGTEEPSPRRTKSR